MCRSGRASAGWTLARSSEGQNYRCEAGDVVITTGDSGSRITPSGAVTTVDIKRTSRLLKAQDGALLIHQKASGGAGLFFVPFVPVADEAWDRFATQPAPERQPWAQMRGLDAQAKRC